MGCRSTTNYGSQHPTSQEGQFFVPKILTSFGKVYAIPQSLQIMSHMQLLFTDQPMPHSLSHQMHNLWPWLFIDDCHFFPFKGGNLDLEWFYPPQKQLQVVNIQSADHYSST